MNDNIVFLYGRESKFMEHLFFITRLNNTILRPVSSPKILYSRNKNIFIEINSIKRYNNLINYLEAMKRSQINFLKSGNIICFSTLEDLCYNQVPFEVFFPSIPINTSELVQFDRKIHYNIDRSSNVYHDVIINKRKKKKYSSDYYNRTW